MTDNFIIETFVLKRQVTNLDDLKTNPYEYLLSIKNQREDASKLLGNIKNNTADGELLRIEGVIYIEYNGKKIIPFTFWDEISTLWPYLINLIEDYIENEEAIYDFPSQPIPISLSRQRSKVNFSVNGNSVLIDEKFFIQKILCSAKEYFDFLQDSIGQQDMFEYQRIKKINDKFR
ncbi:hypothetical protein QA612_19315 [Evansella sp. AB-P1]|uniref:hypothetical protein n=1 Tax=Evansella sp. AB-P1 TaxID=3037653 RepID=UPI00241FF155|nr:hypothetical protein [Evansella sp. AB-P1]MDG5789611.1 hypothetical protein [Evansella sp. AB-P1]